MIGVGWFAAASLLCGLAQNVEMLIAARVLQGVGGALLTPGSLAILERYAKRDARGRVISRPNTGRVPALNEGRRSARRSS